jgi:peroxiredoxin
MTTNTPLKQQLDDFFSQLEQQAPPEVVTTIKNSINGLVNSGLAQEALKEGQKAPHFTLPNPLGQQVELSHLLQKGPVVVTFYRGEWCPFCNVQLHAYQQILPQIKELGATLVAISPQDADHSLSMSEKHALEFHVLSDAGNVVARQYGLVFKMDEPMRAISVQIGANLPTFNGDDSWELPMPGTFIIDQDGIIQLAHVDADFTHRLEPTSLLNALKALKK